MPTKSTHSPETARKKKAADSNTVNANGGRNFRIPSQQIAKAVESLPSEQASAVKWLGAYCRKNDLGKAQMATLLKKPNGKFYGYDSVYQLLTGIRIRKGENITPIIDAIENIRQLETQREKLASSGFIHTRLAGIIWQRCDKARVRQRIGYIFGDSQIGKTEALKEYARRNNHGQTVYVEVPDGGSKGSLLREIANAIGGLSLKVSNERLGDNIIDCIDPSMLIIFDEAHRMFKGAAGLRSLDFIRRLWNKKKCGVMLSLTNEEKKSILSGPNSKELEQIWRRRAQPLQLPDTPFLDDLELFAAAYGLPPADDNPVSITIKVAAENGRIRNQTHTQTSLALQKERITEEGLGVWISLLQDASDIAQELDKQITWGAVLKAHCIDVAESEIIQ